MSEEEKQDLLNQMWRNPCLNDTYEPGSTFKIITMAAGMLEGVVSLNDSFYCPGYKVVETGGSTVRKNRTWSTEFCERCGKFLQSGVY